MSWVYWKLTFFRDKTYVKNPLLWFIDWLRYLRIFDGVRGFDE